MTMKGSPFVVPFEAEMKEWESKLVGSMLSYFKYCVTKRCDFVSCSASKG